MPSLRQMEERRRTLATLKDEVLTPPDPRKHGGMGHAVVITSSTRQAAAVKEFQKEVPTGPEVDISRLTPEERIEWFAISTAKERQRIETLRLQNEATRRAQGEAAEKARKAREEAALRERQQAEARSRQIVDGVLKAAARREILAIIATMTPQEEDTVTQQVRAMGNAYLSMPLAWSAALEAVRAGK